MDTKTLISILSDRLGREPEDVTVLLRSISGILADSVKQGDTVAVPGFGTFEPKMREERVATHPSTGKKILVPPKLSMVFKPSAILKQRVRKF
ncbi:MAG: HU family DNA-binding protein [Muribaculaceae bacterium]|nr:HU family DNA-binding protein [Muribaculaceae bacterium]